MRIEGVYFDLGETLINEGRIFDGWADWLGVPRHTFHAMLGAAIARGESYQEVFEHFRPGFELAEEEAAREAAGVPNIWGEADLYPDARECLTALHAYGVRVGVAGNQPKEAYERVVALDLPVDVIGISELWGVEKPSAEFFDRVVEEAGCPAANLLYVGDRIDNDVRAGLAFGVQVAFLRRGPWGFIGPDIGQDEEALAQCTFRLDSLAELPELVAAHNHPYDQ